MKIDVPKYYYGVPVPLTIRQDFAEGTKEVEYWQRGVLDAQEAAEPLMQALFSTMNAVEVLRDRMEEFLDEDLRR